MTTSSILSEFPAPRLVTRSSFRFLHKLPTYISQTPSPLGRPTPSHLSTLPLLPPMPMGPSTSPSLGASRLEAKRKPQLSRFLQRSNSLPPYSVKPSSSRPFP